MRWLRERQFREDLYFRIKGVTILLPPLRERREDIPLLGLFLPAIGRGRTAMAGRSPALTPEAQQLLMGYSWPGNVRQLQNVIETTWSMLSHGRELGVAKPAAGNSPGRTRHSGGLENLGGISLEQAEREADPQHAENDRRQPRTSRQDPRHRRADAVSEDQGIRVQRMIGFSRSNGIVIMFHEKPFIRRRRL